MKVKISFNLKGHMPFMLALKGFIELTLSDFCFSSFNHCSVFFYLYILNLNIFPDEWPYYKLEYKCLVTFPISLFYLFLGFFLITKKDIGLLL